MPETLPRNAADLEEFHLDLLAELAPADLSAAAPDWEVRRDVILDEIPLTQRSTWWLRAGIAAAALTIVAGTALALDRPDQTVPAAPTSTASARTTVGQTVSGPRRPGPGHWLVSRERQVIFQSNMTPHTQSGDNTTALDADGIQVSWYGKQEGSRGAVEEFLDPTGAPLGTEALRTWLTARAGVRHSSASPSPQGPPQPDADATWTAISNFSTALSTPRELRRALVDVARTLPATTVAPKDGEIRLRHTSVDDRTTITEDLVLDAASLEPKRVVRDSRTPATTTEPRNPAIHHRYETSYQPIVEVAREPKP